MNYYRKVQKLICDTFPEYRELRFGCELILDGDMIVIGANLQEEGYADGVAYFPAGVSDAIEFKFGESDTDFVRGKGDILGQPVTLQMILRMLNEKNDSCCLLTDGQLLDQSNYDNLVTTLDLSKDPIDWDWEEIYNLLKDNHD